MGLGSEDLVGLSSSLGSSVVLGFQEWLRTVGVVRLGEWEGER